MTFIPQSYCLRDTIAAVATPPGDGGVAIIRISGDRAVAIADRLFDNDVTAFKSHTAHYGKIIDGGMTVDSVLLLVMRGGRSYTGEETVEIHCHGGHLITRRLLELVLRSGARAALPGEFTYRAFAHGKLDLAQAEAVQKLIGASNDRAIASSRDQLEGGLSRKIASFQKELTSVAAILEAWVDFPEEGLEFATGDELCKKVADSIIEIEKLLNTFEEGRLIHEGMTLCLVGAPNVGKSSLMNALLDHDRAIVSPIPGTTRDLIEEKLVINGLQVKLVDTAGIRASDDTIEQEGVRRSHKALETADIVLMVLDSSRQLSEEEKLLASQLPREKSIAVWNKSDLPTVTTDGIDLSCSVLLSAQQGRGVDILKQTVDTMLWKNKRDESREPLLTQLRHRTALEEAHRYCLAVVNGLYDQLSPEFIALEMRSALRALGKILGNDITEEVLSSIFATFCIGK